MLSTNWRSHFNFYLKWDAEWLPLKCIEKWLFWWRFPDFSLSCPVESYLTNYEEHEPGPYGFFIKIWWHGSPPYHWGQLRLVGYSLPLHGPECGAEFKMSQDVVFVWILHSLLKSEHTSIPSRAFSQSRSWCRSRKSQQALYQKCWKGQGKCWGHFQL